MRPALTTPGLILLIKLDESGGLVWSKTFDIDSYQEGRGVVQTPDGRYCIAGYVSSSNNNNKGYLIKTDSSGNLVWTKTYQAQGFLSSYFGCIQNTSDDGFVVCSDAGDHLIHDTEIYVVRTDSEGNVIWSNTYGAGGIWNWARGIKQTKDNGFIINGNRDYNSNSRDLYAIRIDSAGNLLWSKTYGGTSSEVAWESAVWETSDGGFVFAGNEASFGSQDLYLVKTDVNGNSGCNEGNPNTTVSNVTTTVSAVTPSSGTGGTLTNLTTAVNTGATETTLCLATSTNQLVKGENLISIFPNPASHQITLAGLNTLAEPRGQSSLLIFNLLSQQVFSSEIKMNGEKAFTINIESLRAGIYKMIVIGDDQISEASFVKL